jgi:glutaredoxin-related protein
MALQDQVQGLLQAAFPDGQVSVADFGGGDHLSAHVRAPQFAGLPLIAQHRLVSAQTVRCLQLAGAEFAAIDILPDPRIRQQLSAHSGWPTIPQLFVDGELVGGCDIVTELSESGELGKIVADAA